MSVTPAREGTTHVECGQCRETFPDNEAVRDAYCSRECYFRSEGSGTLEHIRKDHTVCPTCFSKIKEVEKPPEGTSLVIGPVDHDADGANHHAKDVLIGFQSRTQHAEHVETNLREALFSISETVVVSLGCKCGTPSGYEPDETIERVEGSRVVLNLLRELRQRYAQGELDTQPSKDQLFDALREQGRDWEYAVGRALHA